MASRKPIMQSIFDSFGQTDFQHFTAGAGDVASEDVAALASLRLELVM